jgi:predicted ATPase
LINGLRFRNFKCFEDQDVVFSNLTLLSGMNGMGKSTVLQALLLLRQSFGDKGFPNGFALNGDLTCLGTGKDILYEDAIDDNISLELCYNEKEIAKWMCHYDPNGDFLSFSQLDFNKGTLPSIGLFDNNFHYLNAERIGPRPLFAVSNDIVEKKRQIGTSGEYTAYFLSVFGSKDIPIAGMLNSKAHSSSLLHQIEAWLEAISPGVRLEIRPYRGMDIVNLEYSFVTNRKASNPYRATNVGFGITYILPVLTALLSSSPGSLILLENPEAHIHPRGQVRMGELIALAAANGIQVIVESHSDHILNGIRLAVHSQKISNTDVKLYFFDRNTEDERTYSQITEPIIDKNGRINHWPEGFFDEMTTSLTTLLRPSENHEN